MNTRSPDMSVIPAAKPAIGAAEIEAAVRVLRSGTVTRGPQVAAFEDEFAAPAGARHRVAADSGTRAHRRHGADGRRLTAPSVLQPLNP